MSSVPGNYQIITDEALLRDFIENVLPPLEDNEIYYACLFSRKKYAPDTKQVKSDKSQMKRFTSNKERLFDKIAQLECPLGCYVQANNEGKSVPQEALALYMTINPRDMRRAHIDAIVDLAGMLKTGCVGMNPHQEVMSTIQRAKGRKVFVTFDIDGKKGEDGVGVKDPAVLEVVREALGSFEGHKVLETRGGYHIMVRPDLVPTEFSKRWYQKIASISDVTGDSLIPVPGTYQGGFTPHFINP